MTKGNAAEDSNVLTIKLDTADFVEEFINEHGRAVFGAGFSAGEANGKFDDTTEDEAWAIFRATLNAVPQDDTFVSHDDPDHPLPVYARPSLTLDDVSRRINEICFSHVENAKRFQEVYASALEKLADDVEASADIDKNAVASIVMGRVNTMVKELSEAVA